MRMYGNLYHEQTYHHDILPCNFLFYPGRLRLLLAPFFQTLLFSCHLFFSACFFCSFGFLGLLYQKAKTFQEEQIFITLKIKALQTCSARLRACAA